jgi:purine-binding chemotaxis protein CheW
MEVMVFNLLGALYGVRLNLVKGILVYKDLIITKLFNEKEWVIGVMNLRGEVIPIIDLRIRFQSKAEYNDTTVVIIVETSENKIMGLVVDSIYQIVMTQEELITQSPDISVGIDVKYIEGLFQISNTDMVTLLNIDNLLNIKEFS